MVQPGTGGDVDAFWSSERIAVDWLREGRRVVGVALVDRIGSAPLDPARRC
jgi:hypothetical protein